MKEMGLARTCCLPGPFIRWPERERWRAPFDTMQTGDRNIMKISRYVASFAAFCLVALAGNSHAGAGWSGDATVTGIYTLSETMAIVKLSSFTNPDNCLTDEAGDVFINPTTQKTWFAVLLSAYMASKRVNLYVAGCRPIWANTSYAEVGHVRLR